MAVRRLLVGLLVIALLSVVSIVIRDSIDERNITSLEPVDATPPSATSAEPQPEFPEAELQSGLLALCSNDGEDATEVGEPQTFEHAIQTASERLAASPSAEHLLAAALFRKVVLRTDEESQLDLINRAVLARYAAGDENAALEAMRFASTAAESTIYYAETIELSDRALRAVSDFDFPERAALALGLQSAIAFPQLQGLTTMCREQSSRNAEWAYACLRYGELVERQGKTELSVSVARSVQKLVLEVLGEAEKAAEVEERVQADLQEKRDWAGSSVTTYLLIVNNPTLFYSYLAAIRSVGETVALRGIRAEIERLFRLRPELECE